MSTYTTRFEVTVSRIITFVPDGQHYPREDKTEIMKVRCKTVDPKDFLKVLTNSDVEIEGKDDESLKP